jgi:hypothetical protein
MTIAKQLNIKVFPFIVKDDSGKEIYSEDSDGWWNKREFDDKGQKLYYENSDGKWHKYEYDDKGNVIYYETSCGHIVDSRPKPLRQNLITQMEEMVSRLEEDGGLYALAGIKNGIKEAISELKDMAAPLSEKVDQAHQEFIENVGALKYATGLTKRELCDNGLDRAVRRVVTSYENYVNSKIEYTNEYFNNQNSQ